MKRALVGGAGGFIAGHLVKKLKREGYWVRGVDIKEHEFAPTQADEFMVLDLREPGAHRFPGTDATTTHQLSQLEPADVRHRDVTLAEESLGFLAE